MLNFVLPAIMMLLGVWSEARPKVEDQQSRRNLAEAIWYSEQVVASGRTPETWPNSVFIPASGINTLTGAVVGSKYSLPIGGVDAQNRPDGLLHMTVEHVRIGSDNGLLRPELVVRATYEPVRKRPWWWRAQVQLRVEAAFIPGRTEQQEEGPVTIFRLAPTSITPRFKYGPLSVGANQLLGTILANQAVRRLGERLEVPVPSLAAPLEVDTSMSSESFSKFENGGGVYITTSLDGSVHKRQVSLDRYLVTKKGIWFLGGPLPAVSTPEPPKTDRELKRWLRDHGRRLEQDLAPFQLAQDEIRVRIAKAPVEEIAAELAQPTRPYRLKIGSHSATGEVGKLGLLRDDLLGEISLAVTPANSSFVNGSIDLAPPRLAWTPGLGLSTNVKAKAEIHADLHLHLSTAFVGGGVGANLGITGNTSANMPLALKFARYSTSAGNAVVLHPQLGCTPIEVDVRPDSPHPAIQDIWINVASLGVRLKRNIGDQTIAPVPLFSSLPQFVEFPANKPGQVGKFEYPSKGLELSVDPSSVIVDDGGIQLAATSTITPSEGIDPAVQAAREKALRAALEEASSTSCEGKESYALLVGKVEIGPTNSIVAFIVRMYKAGKHVFDETVKQVEALYKRPIETLAKAPENIIAAGVDAVNDIFDSAGDIIDDIGDTVCDWFGCKRLGPPPTT